MSSILYNLANSGEIDWLSFSFAEFLCQQAGQPLDSLLGQSAALVSEANLAGDVCVDLAKHENRRLFSATSFVPKTPAVDQWAEQLLASDVIGRPGTSSPVILESNRLYLQRNWGYETEVASRLSKKFGPAGAIDLNHLKEVSACLFDHSTDGEDEQKAAVEKAVLQRFSVISGGPGTGKTTTVVKILAAILTLEPDTRIALTAPTGKAAARMSDSINRRKHQLEIEDSIRHLIPTESATLHRLLGFSQNRFRFHQKNLLPFDCVIVDEASMIDLRLMFQLLQALPDKTRLILLGDRDQLASVAAGNVLGDITGHGRSIDAAPPLLRNSISLLRHSYRFEAGGAIAALAEQVNRGNTSATIKLLEEGHPSTVWNNFPETGLSDNTLTMILEAYQQVLDAVSPVEAIRQFDQFRVLATLNKGPQGVIELNRLISSKLQVSKSMDNPELFQGMPVMINRNHHDLGLFNGDTGVIWKKEGLFYACFSDTNGEPRWIRLNRLREFNAAWVTTVHKSQGSEFDRVVLILPEDAESDSLSRELLYTAITRARSRFDLQGGYNVVQATINQLTRRQSGLAEKLGW